MIKFIALCIPPLLFLGYMFLCFKEARLTKLAIGIDKKEIIIGQCLLLVSIIISYLIIKQNKFIYFWDYGREWNSTLDVCKGMLSNPIHEYGSIYMSVLNTDYNHVLPALIAVFIQLFGKSFVWYVMINDIVYMTLAFILIAMVIKKISIMYDFEIKSISYIIFITAFSPIVLFVLYQGFMDGPVLMVIAVIIGISLDITHEKVDLKKHVMLSICLLILVVFKRYMAYYVIGFGCSQFVVAIINGKEKNKMVYFVKNYIVNMLVMGGVFLVALLIAFNKFLIRSFFNNYRNAYSAWNVPTTDKIGRFIQVYGIFIIIISLIVPLIISKKRCKRYKIVLPLIVSSAISIIGVWSIQQMEYHHYYLIAVQMIILTYIGISEIVEALNKKHNKLIGISLCSLLIIVNMVTSFYPQLFNHNVSKLFVTNYHYPRVRNDITTINQIIEDVNKIGKDEGKQCCYAISSSEVLNYDILKMAHLPDAINAVPEMYYTHDVDLRDGFPENFLKSDYVFVTDPIQLHLGKEGQHVIYDLGMLVSDSDSYLGINFKLQKEYTLDNGVKVKLYHKETQFSQDVFVQLQKHFDEIYPDYPKLFHDRLNYENYIK